MRMALRTAIRALVALFLVTLAACFMLDLLPGSPGRAALGASATPEQVEAFNDSHGFNDPPLDRYTAWLGDVVTGELDRSVHTNVPVTETLRERLPTTIQLALLSEAVALAVAIPVGLWAAHRSGGWVDRMANGMSFAMLALAPFVLALVLVFVFAVALGWLPVAGWVPFTENPLQNIRHAALPVLTLAAGELAVYLRIVRSDAKETLAQPFVMAAQAKGMPISRILSRHVLRSSSLTIVTLAGVNLGRLIGGTVVVEQVFALPGIGSAAVQGIVANDFYVVQGIILVVATSYVVLNALVDVGCQIIDPRIRRSAA